MQYKGRTNIESLCPPTNTVQEDEPMLGILYRPTWKWGVPRNLLLIIRRGEMVHETSRAFFVDVGKTRVISSMSRLLQSSIT